MDGNGVPRAALPAAAAAGLSTRWDVRSKHEATYTDAAAKIEVSPLTGSFVACWNSGDVSLLCLRTGALLQRIAAADSDEVEEQFSSFSISPDERTLATVARRSRIIQLWDIATGTQTASWKAAHALPVLDLSFSPSGGEIASCAADKAVVVYSVRRSGVVTHRFAPSPAAPQKGGHKSRVVRLFWHPSVARAQLVSCAEDGEMRLWSLRDSTSALLSNHMSQVVGVAFTRDGDRLISGGRDKVINVWDVSVPPIAAAGGPVHAAHLRTLPVYESIEGVTVLQSRPSCVPAPKDSKSSANKAGAGGAAPAKEVYFVTAGSKGVLRTWALSTLECVHEEALPTAAAPPGAVAAASADESSLTLAQRNAAKYIANQVAHLLHVPAQKVAEAGAANALPERLIAVTAEQNLYVYTASNMKRTKLLLGFNDEIIDIRAHPNNTHAILASNSSQVRVIQLDTFEAALLSGHSDTVLAIDVSPCGQFVVSSSKDTTVRFWRLGFAAADGDVTSECIGIGEGHTESVGCVSFSKNKHTGKLYAVSGARERILKLWDCEPLKTHVAGSPPLRLVAKVSKLAHEKDINCVEVSPNDKLVASGSEDKLIRVWDGFHVPGITDPLGARGVLRGHKRGVWSVRFSPVDKVLASASGDKTVKLWSMDDYTCLKTLESHTASVKQVHFINSGMQLLTAGDDALVKLWTIATSECVNTFPDAHDGKIWAMSVTKDGTRVLTGGSDSVLCVWQDVSAQDIEEAEATRETFVLQEQQLNNLVRQKQWRKAIRMALVLEQPRKCLSIVQDLLLQEANQAAEQQGKEGADATPLAGELPALMAELGTEPPADAPAPAEGELTNDALLTRLLLYIRDWNTHARSAHVAHTLLSHILRTVPPARLLSNRTLLQQSTALTLYAERHFARIDKLLTKSFLMDHMLASMNAVESNVDNATTPKANGLTTNSNDILQQLLASSARDFKQRSPAIRPAQSPAAAAAAATATPGDEDDEGFSDDDGSAWATNWQAPESDSDEEEKAQEKKKKNGKQQDTPVAMEVSDDEPPAPPTGKAKGGKKAAASSPVLKPAKSPKMEAAPTSVAAASKTKRKQPAVAAVEEEEPAPQSKRARASPALKPTAAPAAVAGGKKKSAKKS
jgi:U3 small nucleolar RNA-associated protein 13